MEGIEEIRASATSGKNSLWTRQAAGGPAHRQRTNYDIEMMQELG
jgi:hypothetical protein